MLFFWPQPEKRNANQTSSVAQTQDVRMSHSWTLNYIDGLIDGYTDAVSERSLEVAKPHDLYYSLPLRHNHI